MPQMSPMNWIYLMIYFIMIYLFLLLMLYYLMLNFNFKMNLILDKKFFKLMWY
uniref:ATP synthase F0 subunit 8 n=1 Tax=Cardiochiles fuscipennis TaxID=69312 RepID=A0A0A6ZKY6_9HYME|nr:ATP synthase F0 subunit 8 [Cardiochiles fuscipennis]